MSMVTVVDALFNRILHW